MTYAEQHIAPSRNPWAQWWEAFVEDSRTRHLEHLEQAPVIPSPPPVATRIMLLASLFQPHPSLATPDGEHF